MRRVDSPSPNWNFRPNGVEIDTIVIHSTAGTDLGDLSWLITPSSKVSYHDLIWRDGTVHRLVPYSKRAWHAGKSSWRGRDGMNDSSIGIALSNKTGEAVTDAQYRALAELCKEAMLEFSIKMENIVGHYHIAPERKTDPWPPFDWGRLWEEMRTNGD